MHIYCDQVWRTHKGAVSGGTARPRHEAASRLRHLKRIEAVRQRRLATEDVKEQAQAAAG